MSPAVRIGGSLLSRYFGSTWVVVANHVHAEEAENSYVCLICMAYLYYNLFTALDFNFLDSAAKHGVTFDDAVYAIRCHDRFVELSPRRVEDKTFMFLGHPHGQTGRWIEVGVVVKPNGDRLIFHAMPIMDVHNWPRPEK